MGKNRKQEVVILKLHKRVPLNQNASQQAPQTKEAPQQQQKQMEMVTQVPSKASNSQQEPKANKL